MTMTPAIIPPTSGMNASSATTKASSTANGTPMMDITMKANVAFSEGDHGLADHVVTHRTGDFLGQGLDPGPTGPRREPVAPLLHCRQGGEEVQAQHQHDQGAEQAVRHGGAETDNAAEDAAHGLRVVDELLQLLVDAVPHAELVVDAAEEVGVDEVPDPAGACLTISVTCWTIVGIRVAKNPATASARVETASTMPAAPGEFRAFEPAHHRVQSQSDEECRHDPEEQLRRVGTDPVDQEGKPTPTVPMKPMYRGCWADIRGPGSPNGRCPRSRASASPHAPGAFRSGVVAGLPEGAGAGGRAADKRTLPRQPGAGGCRPGAGTVLRDRVLAAGFLGFFWSGGGRIRMFSHCV